MEAGPGRVRWRWLGSGSRASVAARDMATNPVIPTPKSFVGKRKRTQAVATGIKDADDDFQGGIKKFKPSSTTPVTVCPQPGQWGTGREKQAYSDIDSVQQIGFKSRTRADKKKLQNTSEEFGEMAVEHKLQEQLHDAGLPYDPTGVEKFSASGVFNIVYMYPPLGSNPAPTYKPDYVIVLEAKGGESQCGDRKSK